mgnify:CR=1 FL=1
MDTRQERLSRLDSALLDKRQICSSEGVLCAFPSALKSPFMIDGVGLIICRQGSFTFILNQKTFSAKAGDTLFLPKDSLFQVLQASDNVEVYIFIYQTDPIRDFIHAPILASGHRTVLRMEYRRRRRGFKIPVTIGQYAENRRESF